MPNVELPDPFLFASGSRVQSEADWRQRRQELHDLVVGTQYGGLPPTADFTAEPLHTWTAKRFGGANYTQYRLVHNDDRTFQFRLDVMVPPGEGPFPVVLTGDGCYRYITDELTQDMLNRGFIVAQFSRTAIVPDLYNSDRTTGLYLVYPEKKFGALAAWAWGYHRCIDVLVTLDKVRADAIAVIGHSRGGKTALLAGATDERIALTVANGSGCGGAGSYYCQGPESETLVDTKRAIPYWFGSRLWDYIGCQQEMPFDQHCLKALVAPRPLLTTEGLVDLWSNPTGTWQTHRAAREVYRFLGVEDRIGIHYREGGHTHGPIDWQAFLEFMDWQFCGKPTERRFDANPFPDMQPAFSWSAPERGD